MTDTILPSDTEQSSDETIVVGIGASAGGLEALRALLSNLPARSSMAYVVAQHMAPRYRSMLATLLARETSLAVKEIEDGQRIVANHVYITPPAKDVLIDNGRLQLREPSATIGPKPSIDQFFISLASDKGEKAIGVILSGTGSDGAHGMRAIKAEGGITVVQNEETAKYDGMPRAAIETGLIDLILPPEQIGPKLVEILRHPQLMSPVPIEVPLPTSLQRIFQLLKDNTGTDFSGYKLSTIQRRLDRRMAVHKITDLQDYVNLLQQSPTEIGLLFKDILISVTSFFRDAEAFHALRQIMQGLVKNKKPGDALRIWIPGCATGEEAYSIAIMLAETLGDRLNDYHVQIFGTDIDVDAIARARRGSYPEAVVGEVEEKLRKRYFVREDNIFRVTKAIREMVIFSRQDLTRDPPFSRLDLISCRNVLIYFDLSLQKRIIPMFHYVLVKGGYLFLGKSESVGQFEDLFRTVDRKWKTYQRRDTVRPPVIDFGTVQRSAGEGQARRNPQNIRDIRLRDVMNQAIARAFGNPGVLVDENSRIVHVQGNVSPYLSLSSGDADLSVLSMVRDDLRSDLRALLYRAAREDGPVLSRAFRLSNEDCTEQLRIRAISAQEATTAPGLTLILFQPEPIDMTESAAQDMPDQGKSNARIAELEHELAATREHLHTTIQELETANEELQSLNEELQSANEELQSANEELETANEELQSTNEELMTVNEELQVKSAELAATNSDLENVLKRVGVAMVIVDPYLRITRYTPAITAIFDVHAGDVGQILTTVPCRLDLGSIRQDLMTVINQEAVVEKLVGSGAISYRLQIQPYFSERNHVAGAVLVFREAGNQSHAIIVQHPHE